MIGRALAVAGVLSLGACALPAQPPLLTLGGRQCDAAPVLDGAVAVPLHDHVAVAYGEASHCLLSADAQTRLTYAVFRLPDAPAPYSVTVTSLAKQGVLVSPRLSVLDGNGAVTRSLAPGDFRESLEGLRAGLRIAPRERYLVAVADPARLGQMVTLRMSLRQQGGVDVAGLIIIPIIIPSGGPPVRWKDAIYALNGSIQVAAEPLVTVP